MIERAALEYLDALEADAPIGLPPAYKPRHYDTRLLEMARGVFAATNEYPLNPRDLGSRSLLLADQDWVSDFNLHLAWFSYYRNKHKKRNP